MNLLTVFVGIIAFSNLVLLVAVAALAIRMNSLVNTSVQPLMNKANALMDKVDDKTGKILEISEDTARKVSDSVVATSDTVEKAMVSPILGLSSLAAGLAKAFEVFRGSRGASAQT